MILDKYEKQSGERKDYDILYADWLTPMLDTLFDVTAVIECLTNPADTSLVCETIFVSTTSAKFWLSGGTPKHKYKLTAYAVTVGTRRDESELIFTVKPH